MSKPLFHAAILTLFPDMFPGPLGQALAGKALEDGLWTLQTINIRDFATDKHGSVDDTPYGGGAGMVLRPDIVAAAIRAAESTAPTPPRKIYLSPRGKPLTQNLVEELAEASSLLLLCGRYEGVDQRVLDAEGMEEISVGDYVLAGGEVAAMVLLEAITRLIPGVMGNHATTDEESFCDNLLEYPHFTRPPTWENLSVPEVLLSGHHGKINAWRLEQSQALTKQNRPDLWEKWKKTHETDKNR
ncbi:MAG: tRNA (guanosine(37)-N1)-methyltransferase TrmD [Bdellovibrionales bacterium]